MTDSPIVTSGNDAEAVQTKISALSEGDGADLPTAVGRYKIHGEIARGGMGVVYRATDTVLGREVAVKVLQERFEPGSATARRFVGEAKIAGQLQHPGIPAVHDLGTLPDGRPFLAMRLIKGRTLDELLKDRGPGSPNLIAVFEQVCQAVGYAHAHGVVHRDLKPANVMVGAFGEVQVMDWGLAKVLTSRDREPADFDPNATTAAATQIDSDRDDSDATRAGSVLGTPAYMPPEQAIGAVDQVDARSDVFGLGAMLCAILTGKPPYVGADAEATRQLAAWAKLDDAFARLDSSGTERELAALCRSCLSAEKTSRPAAAGEVAIAVAGLRAAADERARQAELDRVRATEQRKRARVQLALAAVVAVLVTGAGAIGWWAYRQETQSRIELERRQIAELRHRRSEDAIRHLELGNAIAQRGDVEGAIRCWRWAINSDPYVSEDAYYRLSHALMERGDLEGAIATCQEGIKLHPKSSHARIGLGNALYAKKDFDGAITAYREAIKIILTSDLPYVNGDTYNRLGNALRAKDDLDGAITAYREAIKIDPRNAEAHTNLGDALYRKGDSGGAIAAYTNLASVLKAKGDHDGAIACYREAIRIEPKYAAAHNNLAWLLATGPDGVRDGNQALEHAIRACELTAWNNGIYIDTLAAAYAEAGNFDNAIEYQKKALGLSSPAIEKEFGPEMRQRTGLYAQKRPYRDPKLHRRDPAPPPEGNEKRP